MSRLNAEVRLTGRVFVGSAGSSFCLQMGDRSADLSSGCTDPVRLTNRQSFIVASSNRDGGSLKRSVWMRSALGDFPFFSLVMIADLSAKLKRSGTSKCRFYTMVVVFNGGRSLSIKALNASGPTLARVTSVSPFNARAHLIRKHFVLGFAIAGSSATWLWSRLLFRRN